MTYDNIPADVVKEAEFTQGACNGVALINSLQRVYLRLSKQAREEGHGTDWLNKHPVMTMYLSQLVWLNHQGSVDACVYASAQQALQASGGA
jgi:hypothetical protein